MAQPELKLLRQTRQVFSGRELRQKDLKIVRMNQLEQVGAVQPRWPVAEGSFQRRAAVADGAGRIQAPRQFNFERIALHARGDRAHEREPHLPIVRPGRDHQRRTLPSSGRGLLTREKDALLSRLKRMLDRKEPDYAT